MRQTESLAAAFRAEFVRSEGLGVVSTSGDCDLALESELAAACARGRAAFNQVVLDDWTFVRHLARALKTSAGSAAQISLLALEDLYLACACLAGCGKAAAAFAARYGGAVRASVRDIVEGTEAEDVYEQLMQALLVGSANAPAKIGTYSGKASLERWLGVSARRAALMCLRKNRAEGRVRRAAAAEPPARTNGGPETAYIKARYRGEFERALGEALERLPERDQVLLRLYLVNGVTVERIATMFKVGKATVSRWLAAARSSLLDDVKQALRSRLGTSSDELASLARMVASRLDLSLQVFLKGA